MKGVTNSDKTFRFNLALDNRLNRFVMAPAEADAVQTNMNWKMRGGLRIKFKHQANCIYKMVMIV